jgi:hypothetical protein
MMRGKLPLLILVLLGATAWAADWKTSAVDLGSEDPKAVAAAKADLEARPDLDSILSKAIDSTAGDDRQAALLVTRVLRRHGLFKKLLDRAKTDMDRELFAALGAVETSSDEAALAPVLSVRLGETKTNPVTAGAKVEILRTFAQLKALLTPAQLEPLLHDSNPQVRVSAAALAGKYRAKRHLAEYDQSLLVALDSKPYQLRLEALQWIDQTPAHSPVRARTSVCLNDPNEQVRSLCRKVAEK